MGIKNVITLGEKDCSIQMVKKKFISRQLKIKLLIQVQDAFMEVFIALLKEKIKECLEIANKIAGLSTTKLGAGDSMPTFKELI